MICRFHSTIVLILLTFCCHIDMCYSIIHLFFSPFCASLAQLLNDCSLWRGAALHVFQNILLFSARNYPIVFIVIIIFDSWLFGLFILGIYNASTGISLHQQKPVWLRLRLRLSVGIDNATPTMKSNMLFDFSESHGLKFGLNTRYCRWINARQFWIRAGNEGVSALGHPSIEKLTSRGRIAVLLSRYGTFSQVDAIFGYWNCSYWLQSV